MYFELKENRPHGTPENPFSQYHISDVKRAFQIPVHWHDELEIIYVKQGKLHVTISGKNYIGSPKDAFVVSPVCRVAGFLLIQNTFFYLLFTYIIFISFYNKTADFCNINCKL